MGNHFEVPLEKKDSALAKNSKATLETMIKTYHFVKNAILEDESIPIHGKEALLLNIENKMTELNEKMDNLKKASTKRAHFSPNTKEPSAVHSDKLISISPIEKIIFSYRHQMHKRPEGVNELPIQEVIQKTLETGISHGQNIKLTINGQIVQVPETIGEMDIKKFIAKIQEINNDEQTARAQAQGLGFDDSDLVEAAQTSQQPIVPHPPEEPSSHLPLLHTKQITPHAPSTAKSTEIFKRKLKNTSEETEPEAAQPQFPRIR